MKKLLSIAGFTVCVLLLFSGCGTEKIETDADQNTASLLILDDQGQEILNCDVTFETGDTVADILIDAGKDHKIAIAKSGLGSSVYIQSINGLAEMDKGPYSGWLYYVNGVKPDASCGSYTVENGDQIEWRYSENYLEEEGAA